MRWLLLALLGVLLFAAVSWAFLIFVVVNVLRALRVIPQ